MVWDGFRNWQDWMVELQHQWILTKNLDKKKNGTVATTHFCVENNMATNTKHTMPRLTIYRCSAWYWTVLRRTSCYNKSISLQIATLFVCLFAFQVFVYLQHIWGVEASR